MFYVIESPFDLRLEDLAQNFPLYRNVLNLIFKATILKSFLHKYLTGLLFAKLILVGEAKLKNSFLTYEKRKKGSHI